MSDLAAWTDEQLKARGDEIAAQCALLFEEATTIGVEQAKRRVAERYARWGNRKSDEQFDLDNEAEAQGVSTRSLLR